MHAKLSILTLTNLSLYFLYNVLWVIITNDSILHALKKLFFHNYSHGKIIRHRNHKGGKSHFYGRMVRQIWPHKKAMFWGVHSSDVHYRGGLEVMCTQQWGKPVGRCRARGGGTDCCTVYSVYRHSLWRHHATNGSPTSEIIQQLAPPTSYIEYKSISKPVKSN